MIHQSGTKLEGSELTTLEVKEQSQVEKIRVFFQQHPNQYYSAEDVYRNVNIGLLTSIRRALTDLTTAKFLVKHKEKKKPGTYGVKLVTYVHHVEVSQMKMEI